MDQIWLKEKLVLNMFYICLQEQIISKLNHERMKLCEPVLDLFVSFRTLVYIDFPENI